MPRLNLPWSLLLAATAGIVSVAAFAPFGAFWLLPFALALLFRLADGRRARDAALIGLAYGIGQYGAGTYWILIALYIVGGAPLPLAAAMLVGLVILLSLFIAATLALVARVAPTPSALRYLLWLPALWVLIEWLRSWVFSGFPWFALGYSQISSPLAGIAPILGVFGASWAVALSAGLLAWLSARPKRAPWAVAALALIWGGAYGLQQIRWTHSAGAPLTVALVQGDVAQQMKWTRAAINASIDRYAQLTHGHWDANLVIWPETAIPDYYSDVKPVLDQLGQRLAAHHTTLITGLIRSGASNDHLYNSAVAVGAGRGVYDKRHLVPFGEYFPVPRFVRKWMAESGLPYADFTPGAHRQKPIVADGVPLGTSICYEGIFGALIASDVPPAQVLINISDDAWFGRSIGPEQHFEIARMRAVETGRYLLRVDNSAVTAIVAPDGRVVKRAPGFEPTVVSGRFRPYAGLTPFSRWGESVLVLLSLLVLAAGGLLRFIARKRPAT